MRVGGCKGGGEREGYLNNVALLLRVVRLKVFEKADLDHGLLVELPLIPYYLEGYALAGFSI